ncbi:alkaline phosphatase [Colwellia sp. PAMC 21821]|uniref:alkaline phosphatase n=1 Tax=Colwellia sp. PAMC 21821 TaxID=1816219 RepID=UPI0009BD6A9A|nr:alkaline phosphatase [Colwellia sp. PAMC 21821]ARD45914.1 alkaline phosphatase [Colwellia sp. PAMC 21821]
MNKIFATFALTCFTLSCANDHKSTEVDTQSVTTYSTPKNIIMIIGDGMGPAYTTAYRYFKDDPNTPKVENTVFDRHLVGMSSTYPDTQHHYVTDSAASATALSSGIKTYNGAVGVDINKNAVETVLERAKSVGKKTGIVVTSQINHATPASYLTHNESRYSYNEIADSFLDNGIKADLYLGGGWKYFIREDRNLVNEFKEKGFTYVDTYQALETITESKPLLGLFGDSGLSSALDDSNKHRLSTMTKAATKQLENENGYFMLIEASQIDWGGHSNDIAFAMGEIDDLAKTLEYLESYVKSHPDTLIVVTADHSTGGFTLAANGAFEWKPEILRTMKQSTHSIANTLEMKDITQINVNTLFNFELTKDELSSLITAKIDAIAANKIISITDREKSKTIDVNTALYIAVKAIINTRTNSGWTSSGHTAVDVPVFAMGANKELFNGFQDNTDIAKKIFSLLNENK